MKRTGKTSILRLALVVLSAVMLLGAFAVASFAADTAEVRYQISGGDWTEATFVDAMTAVDGKTAIIELQKDVTLTVGLTITGGDISVQSTATGSNVYAIKRNDAFAAPVFTLKAGKLTFKNVTLDGQGKKAAVDGAMIHMPVAGANLILDSGTTLKDSLTSKNGGAIWVTAGNVTMNSGAKILGAEGLKGGAIYLDKAAVLTMNDALIKGCVTPKSGSAIGAAVYLNGGNSTLEMNGGEITENISNRTAEGAGQGENTFIDGAVGSIYDCKIFLSGKAKIHNNSGRLYVNGSAAAVATVGADIVPYSTHRAKVAITIEDNFSGLVGIAKFGVSPIATVSANYAVGTVIDGIYDCDKSGNVAKVTDSGTVTWAPAEENPHEARYYIDGGVWQKGTFAEAMAAVNGKTAIVELFKDVTLAAGVKITGGDITVQSWDGSPYTITRASTLKNASMFTVNGGTVGATLTFENITIDGNKNMDPGVNGGAVSLTGTKDTVILNTGAIIQYSGATSKNGGAIYAPAGTVEMNDGSAILNCKGSQGGAIYLGHQTTDANVVFNMNGGLIKGCECGNGFGSGAAVYLRGHTTFNMAGGLITENTSKRDRGGDDHEANTFIDGAVSGLVNSKHPNQITMSGQATIRDNYGYLFDGTALSEVPVLGADLVYTTTHYVGTNLTIASDFVGSFGLAASIHIATPSTSNKIAVAGEGWTEGTVISGLIDSNRGNVAVVGSNGYIKWSKADAEVDTGDGYLKRYLTLADALTAASKAEKATVTILGDVTLTAGLAITGGDVTIQSKEGETYTVYRDSAFKTPCFTLSGGAKVTFKNITLDGQNKIANSALTQMILLTTVNDTLVLDSGATIQNSKTSGSDYSGGAIRAPYGTVEMKPGSAILNCSATKGGALYLGNTATANSTVFNMSGGLIRGCTVGAGWTSGAAIYMEGYATFNMSGGLITECESGRNASDVAKHLEGTFVDGAVALWRDTNVINLSGDATIRGNKGYRLENGAFSSELRVGADIVMTVEYGVPKMINISKDFQGSVRISNPFSGIETASRAISIATATAYAAGDVIPGIIDGNSNRLSSVMSDLLTYWDVAAAEVDYNGKILRFATLEDAYALVGDKAPIKLLANVTNADLFLWTGETVKLILNGYTVSFTEGTECDSATATEKVGAFTDEGYTYEGKDAEVTTYTATKVAHVCTTEGATETEPAFCSCGKLSAFPTDEAKNVRYSTDGGKTWTYASLAAAMSAVSGETAIVEIYRDITLTAGFTVSGDLTIRSFPTELNGVDGDKLYTVQRGSAFATSMFTVSGGKLTFADITLDGNGDKVTATAAGAVVKFAATAVTTDTLVLDSGATIQNSNVAKLNGGAIYADYGNVIINDGATIRDCHGGKGGAIYLGTRDTAGSATITMNGGIITGCSAAANTNTGHGAAVYMNGNVTFTMAGGIIVGNTSYRTYADTSKQEENVFIDGAIGNIYTSNKIYLSGDATIRNNYGVIYKGASTSKTVVFGADLVFYAGYRSTDAIYIAEDFTGSLGISFPSTGKIATVATDYEVGTILGTIIEANTGKVAKVTASGTLKWTDAEAEVDLDGKITRFETLDEAYATVGGETPIKLVNNATITTLNVGDTAKIVENGHSLTVVSEGSFEKSEGEQVVFGTFTFKGEEFAGETVTAVTYTIIEGGQVTNVALAAGTDLSLYFYANIGSKFADATLRVTREGNTVELNSTYDETQGLYCFVYRDVAPQCAGDSISVELVSGDKILFTFDGYSVALYCKQVLGMTSESLGFTAEKGAELKTLLRDLLTYCASAQVYRNHKTDALVNEGIKGSEYVLPAYSPKNFVVNNTVDGVTYVNAGLRFYNDNRLWFTFTTPDVENTSLVIGANTYTSKDFELVSGNTYVCYGEALRATQFDTVFTTKLYFGETLVQTGTYSVGAYAHSIVSAPAGTYTEAEVALAKATYNYGVAARIFVDSYSAKPYTAKALVNTYGAKTIGGTSFDGTTLVMNNAASGAEFTFRGKGNVVLNLSASEASRVEITVDGAVLEHFLVEAGTKDYTVKSGLADGTHTVRIVQENGAVTLNSISVKGYFTATEKNERLYVQFVGNDLLLGKNLFLNFNAYEDDATGAYAVLAARDLGAKYLISETFVASAETPDLVVIEYKSGADNASLISKIRAAYGADVKLIFVGADETISSMEEDFCNLTKSTAGVGGYPTMGDAAIQGAELAKYIRENSGLFTEEEIAEAKKDILVVVDEVDATSGYNTFHVFVRTSDPSGKYYVLYDFIHQYDLVRDKFTGNSCTNISNFRVIDAYCVEVTGIENNTVTYNRVARVLTGGEISSALKTDGATDFTGGFHGDEWIRSIDGVDGHLTDEGWIPAAILKVDGNQINIVGGEAQVITGSTLTFDQTTMMYEWATSSNEPEDELAKRGEPLTTHIQHFTITRESGIHNRQNYEWQQDITILPKSNYLLMFTMARMDDDLGVDVVTDFEVFDVNGESNGTHHVQGKIDVSSYQILCDSTNRQIYYDGELGVFANVRYDYCGVEDFSENAIEIVDMRVDVRGGDNKLYVRFGSADGYDKVVAGEFWSLDVAYKIDYVNPNN